MKRKARRKLYHILEDADYGHWVGKLDRVLLSVLIFLDISAFILETSPPLNLHYHWLFRSIGIFSTVVFTVEYGLRIWLCTVEYRFRHPVWGRLRYSLTPMAIVDFISTFPFYLLLVFHNLAFLKTLRLFRLARILKIGRYSKSLRSLAKVIISKQEELFITLSIISFLLIIASSLMFFAEHDAQPEAFSSIPAAMWWGVITLTTVGYGDIYPVTLTGKLLGASLACFGIGVFVLPAGIVASSFAAEVSKDAINPTNIDSENSRAEVNYINEQYSQPTLQQIRAEARLLKYCLQTAHEELGEFDKSEEAIASWAMFLYIQAKEPDLSQLTNQD